MSELKKEDAVKYLELYLGPADWNYHIGVLFRRLNRNFGPRVGEEIRKQICCAILLPYFTSTAIPDDPSELLYKCRYYHQFEERDWWEDLQKIMKEDEQIKANRGKCLALGRVEKIKLSPITRQAFNWMYNSAEEGGFITPQNKQVIVQKLKNVIYAYGGTPINNVYSKHPNMLKKVVNWHTNYFIEKILFEAYSLEQLVKMKKQELAKTNEKLVVGII